MLQLTYNTGLVYCFAVVYVRVSQVLKVDGITNAANMHMHEAYKG